MRCNRTTDYSHPKPSSHSKPSSYSKPSSHSRHSYYLISSCSNPKSKHLLPQYDATFLSLGTSKRCKSAFER